MKKIVLSMFLLLAVLASASAQYQKGMTANGATGLIVIPTGRIGWEKSNFGFDVGYGGLFGSGFNGYGNLVKANFTLFKLFELGVTWDAELFNNNKNNFSNIILHTKFQAYKKGAASLAVGGNFQMNGIGRNNVYPAGQIYLAATYSGAFFDWPASSTLFFGKSFHKNLNWDFDFGMGFELSLFPKTFKDIVSLIVEIGNFSYVHGPQYSNMNAGSRGLVNVAVRLDPIKSKNFKLGIDIIGADLLDDSRSLGFQVCFGMAI